MRLLYCYIQFLDEDGKAAPFRGLDQIELNFSTVDHFEYDLSTGVLSQSKRDGPLPEYFWNTKTAADLESSVANNEDTNIYNINVVCGENGSGKTTAIHCLIDLLDGLHAAVDFNVNDRNRMEKLGVAGNRALLLLESDGGRYLLDYAPFAAKEYDHLLEGFPEDRPLRFTCRSWKDFAETQDKTGRTIAELLRKTKVVNLNNTLSQRDYERHARVQNERLRDFFVYDASIGSTIGPDISQFFPYEVYKQVRYIFDRNQAAKRDALKERGYELRFPDALRLRLRMELLRFMHDNYVQSDSEASGRAALDTWDNQRSQIEQQLSSALEYLCVAAFVENLQLLAGMTFHPQLDSKFFSFNESSSARQCTALLKDIGEQFIFTVSSHFLKGHADEITCVTALGERFVVSGSRDCTLRVWDAYTGACLQVLKTHGEISCVTALPEEYGTLVVCGYYKNRSLEVWDPMNEGYLYTMWENRHEVWCLTTLNDGRVVSGSHDHTLRVWDVARDQYQYRGILGEHNGAVGCVVALKNGRVVSGSRDNTLKVWDVNASECLCTLEGHNDTVWCVAALNDGRVVSGSHDHTLKVWDIDKCDCLKTLRGHGNQVTCVAALNDGRVVSGSRDHTLRVWNTDTGDYVRTLETSRGAITCMATLSDNSIVRGSDDASLRIWSYQWISGIRSSTPRQRRESLDKAQRLEEICKEYVEFLSDKDASLLSRFKRIDWQTYELSLNTVEKEGEAQGRRQSEEADTLIADLIDFIQEYRYTCEPTYTIDFDWGLSSGEENMLRIFSNLYHVFDRDYSSGNCGDYRIYNNESHSNDDSAKTPCDSVLLFMDEADLTLHPEWQRRLVNILATFIPQIYPRSCAQDIQLILSTHSPLLLGDIPSENITYLQSKEGEALEKRVGPSEKTDEAKHPAHPVQDNAGGFETFGQNIHTILKESFFLNNGTVGEFAGNRINRIAMQLKQIKERAKRDLSVRKELQEIRQGINIVSHGILRTRLEMLYREAEAEIRRQEATRSVPTVQQLLHDARSLSPEDLDMLLEVLSRESETDD